LENIILFLPFEYKSICQNVCKFWLKNLKSNLSKKMLFSIPKNIVFHMSINLDFLPRAMAKIGNYMYVSSNFESCKFNIENYQIEKENLKTNLISSNNNYICVANSYQIDVYSSEKKISGQDTNKRNHKISN
jgi:hypothetical protein